MIWFEILIKTTHEANDVITVILEDLGCEGVAIVDPNEIKEQIKDSNTFDYIDDEFIDNLSKDTLIKAYFSSEKNIIKLCEQIKIKLEEISQYFNVGKGKIEYKEIDEEDWANSWKKYFKPFNITDNIVIKPSWEIYEKTDNEIIIELDPGMAFGTGTHETTALCAKLLEKYMKKEDTVIDIGTGTGILSIIAAKLGASHIDSIDIDKKATIIAKENSNINGVDDKISIFCGELIEKLNPPQKKVDIIVVNIIANAIIGLSNNIPLYLRQKGYFVCSGIIKDRKDDVIKACQKQSLIVEETIELGEWVAIVFKCQDFL